MGAMVQVDASPFAWFQARGPGLVLVGGMDDATGTIVGLTFRPTEDLHGYTELCRQMFTQYGLPVTIYGDRLNILVRNDAHWTLEEELRGAQDPTHLGSMLRDLGVGYLTAHSPQAKGRIERLWLTLQDRLVSELRLHGICTMAAANAFLPQFIATFNRRFGRSPQNPTSVWRRPPPDLDLLLSCRYKHTVARDHTVRVGSRRMALPRDPRRSWAGYRVDVRELLTGELVVPLPRRAAGHPALARPVHPHAPDEPQSRTSPPASGCHSGCGGRRARASDCGRVAPRRCPHRPRRYRRPASGPAHDHGFRPPIIPGAGLPLHLTAARASQANGG